VISELICRHAGFIAGVGLTDVYNRFFYADERSEDGKLKGMALDGPAHGEFYAKLAEHPAGIPWDATFVKGKGHVQFK
jgi:hypothetical protein